MPEAADGMHPCWRCRGDGTVNIGGNSRSCPSCGGVGELLVPVFVPGHGEPYLNLLTTTGGNQTFRDTMDAIRKGIIQGHGLPPHLLGTQDEADRAALAKSVKDVEGVEAEVMNRRDRREQARKAKRTEGFPSYLDDQARAFLTGGGGIDAGWVQGYQCRACRPGLIITLARDAGVVPFLFTCPTCKGLAQSVGDSNMRPLLMTRTPTIEWYRPTDREYEGLTPAEQDHCRKCGLLYRDIPEGKK